MSQIERDSTVGQTARQISRKKWKDKNKEHTNAYNRAKYGSNPEPFKARVTRHKENVDWKRRDTNTMLLSQYGITIEEYEILLAKQSGVCAICDQLETSCSRWNPDEPKRLAVDHDHTTNKVRGLLCGKCNRALGSFGDSIDGLERAINYLRRYSE